MNLRLMKANPVVGSIYRQNISMTIEIRLIDSQATKIQHLDSNSTICTSVSPIYGGKGDDFSSTDLLAAALGSCIGSSLAPVLQRAGISLDKIHITVVKQLSSNPKKIILLQTNVLIQQEINEIMLKKLIKTAQTCPVHRSLNPEINAPVIFEIQEI